MLLFVKLASHLKKIGSFLNSSVRSSSTVPEKFRNNSVFTIVTIYRLFQLLIVGETFTMLTFVSAKSGTESGCNELPRIPQSTLRHDSATRIRRWVYLCRKRKGEKEREKRSGVRSNEANARVFSRCSDQACNGNATRISRCSQGQQRECMSPGCERQIFPGPESEDQAFRIVSLMPRNLFTATSLRFWMSKASG